MQDMIRKIIEADNEAKALAEANQKAAEEEKLKIEKEAEAIYKQQMDNAKKKNTKNDDYLEKRYNRKWTNIQAKQASALIKLKADYEQDCDRWVDDIVRRVLE